MGLLVSIRGLFLAIYYRRGLASCSTSCIPDSESHIIHALELVPLLQATVLC